MPGNLSNTDLREGTVDKQNITLSLPKDILMRVKVMVAKQHLSKTME